MRSALQSVGLTILRLSIFAIVLSGVVAHAQVTRLSFRPVDAAYSLPTDRVILISENPNRLHIYNAATGSDQTLALPEAPLNLSLSSDGTHAAVAYLDAVSYIDLQAATIRSDILECRCRNREGDSWK